jgi:hypothetical protein
MPGIFQIVCFYCADKDVMIRVLIKILFKKNKEKK